MLKVIIVVELLQASTTSTTSNSSQISINSRTSNASMETYISELRSTPISFTYQNSEQNVLETNLSNYDLLGDILSGSGYEYYNHNIMDEISSEEVGELLSNKSIGNIQLSEQMIKKLKQEQERPDSGYSSNRSSDTRKIKSLVTFSVKPPKDIIDARGNAAQKAYPTTSPAASTSKLQNEAEEVYNREFYSIINREEEPNFYSSLFSIRDYI